jgi:hypothetical protein
MALAALIFAVGVGVWAVIARDVTHVLLAVVIILVALAMHPGLHW